MKVTIQALKEKFENGDKPTQNDYINLIDTLKNDDAPLSTNTPFLVQQLDSKKLFRVYINEKFPSKNLNNRFGLPVGAEIINANLLAEKATINGTGLYVKSETTAPNAQGRTNWKLKSLQYEDDNDNRVNVVSAKLRLTTDPNDPNADKYDIIYSGSPVIVPTERSSNTSFYLEVISVEIQNGIYAMASGTTSAVFFQNTKGGEPQTKSLNMAKELDYLISRSNFKAKQETLLLNANYGGALLANSNLQANCYKVSGVIEYLVTK